MPDCKICCLYSGSRGNSAYIEAGGAKILIDAGKSAKALCSALREINVGIDTIDAIFITHEHRDHISALQTLTHKHSIPIYMLLGSAKVFDGFMDERLCSCLMLQMKESFSVRIKGLSVSAFPTSHDSRASVGYKLTFTEGGEEYSIGYATDTGYVTDEMHRMLTGCFAAVIESNHDPDMLREGCYPVELKARIRSRKGHLSNGDCAEFVSHLCKNGASHIMLAHLSEENNLPALAYNENLCAAADDGVILKVAEQDRAVWLIGED